MNKDRRSRLEAELRGMEALRPDVEALERLKEAMHSVRDTLQEVLDEEQEAFDNLPENMQAGERGEAMQEAISSLAQAVLDVDEIIEIEIDGKFEEIVNNIEEAISR